MLTEERKHFPFLILGLEADMIGKDNLVLLLSEIKLKQVIVQNVFQKLHNIK